MAVPKLRFKEFEGYLTESKLIELTSWASGGTPAKDIPEYWGDDIPLISGASMHTNQLYESDVKITKLGLQKGSKLAPKDSILILVRGSMLFNKIPMGITLVDVAFNQDVKCIRPKQELAPLFLFQWLHAKENTIQNKVTATGIGAGKLDTADLQNLKLYKPSSEEQTKIASFLSAVDEKINQLTQKHQLLSQYKQGMMQKLFSQQIRFKADDGSEYGEWDFIELGEALSYEQPTKYIVSSTEYLDTYPTPVLTAGKSFILGYTNEQTGIFDASNNNVIIFDDFTTAYKFVNFRFKVKSSAMKILKTNPAQNNIYYLYSTFSTLNFPIGEEHKRRWISEYSKQEIPLPCLAEQTKIANFLSSIDQKIEVTSQQIEQAKQWKKGLLQQMFV